MEKPQNNDTMPLRNGFNFTPIDASDNVRVRMRIDPEVLSALPRGTVPHRFIGLVKDLDTDIQYRCFAKSCSLPGCCCDVEIQEVQKGALQ